MDEREHLPRVAEQHEEDGDELGDVVVGHGGGYRRAGPCIPLPPCSAHLRLNSYTFTLTHTRPVKRITTTYVLSYC